KQLIEAAKVAPENVAMGYSGLGTPNHLAMLNLETVAQVQFNGIAYKGSGPMLQDMLAGHIELAADQFSTSRQYIQSGDLVPIAVFGDPLDELPNVPSVSTLGPEPCDVTTYLGLSAPSDTPDEVIQALQKAAKTALEDPRFVKGMDTMGANVYWGSAQDYQGRMTNEDKFMQDMIVSGKIKTS